jgi:hypothetical protein
MMPVHMVNECESEASGYLGYAHQFENDHVRYYVVCTLRGLEGASGDSFTTRTRDRLELESEGHD